MSGCRDGVNFTAVALQIGREGQLRRLVPLRVLVLGRNEQSGTPNELVVVLMDDALGCVMVHKVFNFTRFVNLYEPDRNGCGID